MTPGSAFLEWRRTAVILALALDDNEALELWESMVGKRDVYKVEEQVLNDEVSVDSVEKEKEKDEL